MTTLLLVEDDAKIRASLVFLLRAEGYAVSTAASAEEAWSSLTSGEVPPQLLLLDIRLPGMSGIDLLRRLSAAGTLPPTVVLSGEASISETVEALRLGVHDFLEKPFSRERLLKALSNTLENAMLRRRVAALEAATPDRELLGDSLPMQRLRDAVARVAATDGRVLIRGESGTGKELVANAIHRQSRRREGPFVRLNCAAIPPPLVEDALFGHARGAFTDAKEARGGVFEEAHRGTLLLDEIGDMELPLQARLLRVLEDGGVRRVGENRDRQVDVRVLAATHQALEAAVSAGRFRQDLYYRLAHLPIDVPPLRERPGDVALLVRHFLPHYAHRHGLRPKLIEPALLACLDRYGWPGNVRELRNLCERLAIFGGEILTADDLPIEMREATPGAGPLSGLLRLDGTWPPPAWREFKSSSEREFLELVLRRTRWNFSATARLLGLQRAYLHEKCTALGIARPLPADEPETGV